MDKGETVKSIKWNLAREKNDTMVVQPSRKKKETVHYIIDTESSIFHGPEALLSSESIVATYRSIYCQSHGMEVLAFRSF